MKKIALIAATVVVAGCATGPQLPPLEVVAVHDAPNKTKQEICNAARDWTALTFKDSKAVVEVFDADQGKLIGKGNMRLFAITDPAPTDFTLVIECKDGRARSTFSSFQPRLKGEPYPLVSDSIINLRKQAETKTAQLNEELGAYLRNPKVGSNW